MATVAPSVPTLDRAGPALRQPSVMGFRVPALAAALAEALAAALSAALSEASGPAARVSPSELPAHPAAGQRSRAAAPARCRPAMAVAIGCPKEAGSPEGTMSEVRRSPQGLP
jgi:hypothetical protein